jgi:four helix bundle protein
MVHSNKVRDYKDLDVWNRSMDLVVDVYDVVKSFPQEEQYSLVSQIKGSAISIPSNISEGASRNSKKELVQFFYIALGSASELEAQLLISKRLGYSTNLDNLFSEITIIRKMLNSLISSLKRKISNTNN